MSDEAEKFIADQLAGQHDQCIQRLVDEGALLTGTGCTPPPPRSIDIPAHLAGQIPEELLPLFAAGPEPSGPYKVAGLTACGQERRGAWVVFWADAPRPLHGLQDREAVMRELAVDPDLYKIHAPSPITKNEKSWRTWWYCWPKNLPDPGV